MEKLRTRTWRPQRCVDEPISSRTRMRLRDTVSSGPSTHPESLGLESTEDSGFQTSRKGRSTTFISKEKSRTSSHSYPKDSKPIANIRISTKKKDSSKAQVDSNPSHLEYVSPTGYENLPATRKKRPTTSSTQENSHPSTYLDSKNIEPIAHSSLAPIRKKRSTPSSSRENSCPITYCNSKNLEPIAHSSFAPIRKKRSTSTNTGENSHPSAYPKNSDPIANYSSSPTRKKRRFASRAGTDSNLSLNPETRVLETTGCDNSLKTQKKTVSNDQNSPRSSRAEENEKSTKCSICLDTTRCKKMKFLPCGHGFHEKCVDQWLKSNDKCPICRSPSNGQDVSNTNSVEENDNFSSVLNQEGGHGFLLFLLVASRVLNAEFPSS